MSMYYKNYKLDFLRPLRMAIRHFSIKRARSKTGFTIVELLIVIFVMGLLTGLVLVKYRGYGQNARFANATENIILAIRQAQVYGVGVKGSVGCGGGTTFDCSYGVYFSPATPGAITIFVDNNNSGTFDAGESISTVLLDIPTTITSVTCDGGACVGNALNITFRRPNPSATIHDASATTFTTGTVGVSDGTRSSVITITKAGQISLQ